MRSSKPVSKSLFAIIVSLWRVLYSSAVNCISSVETVYGFFNPTKQYRYHFVYYSVLNIQIFILCLFVFTITSFLNDGETVLSIVGKLLLVIVLLWVVRLLDWASQKMAGSGTFLAWYPGMGIKNKDGSMRPTLIGRMSFKMPSKSTSEVPDDSCPRLPFPKREPFALGAANINETVLRGTKVVDGWQYRNNLESQYQNGLRADLVTFGVVPMEPEAEPQHILISGKSGAGKTQEINAILRTARYKRGNPAVIADPAGGYVSRFYASGDVILNPFDERTASWSPFAEIEYDYDCSTIAKATIPDGVGEGGQWNHYAQTLLGEVLLALWKNGETHVQSVLHYCTNADREELAELLAGTPAEILTQHGNERMLTNTRSIIATYMMSWRYLKDDSKPFSIRKFIRDSDKSKAFLFLTYTDAQMSMLKFLIATFMELAVIEGLSLQESYSRRLWLVMDELDSLGQISSLRAGLTKLRKYGVCCVCGIQTVAQLRDTYGRDEAQTLLSCMATKLVLAPGDNETADYMSKELGEQEIERVQITQGVSGQMQDVIKTDSVNKHLHRQVQQAVMASQLLNLPNRHGYVRFPGSNVLQTVIPYEAMPELVVPYIPVKTK